MVRCGVRRPWASLGRLCPRLVGCSFRTTISTTSMRPRCCVCRATRPSILAWGSMRGSVVVDSRTCMASIGGRARRWEKVGASRMCPRSISVAERRGGVIRPCGVALSFRRATTRSTMRVIAVHFQVLLRLAMRFQNWMRRSFRLGPTSRVGSWALSMSARMGAVRRSCKRGRASSCLVTGVLSGWPMNRLTTRLPACVNGGVTKASRRTACACPLWARRWTSGVADARGL